MSKKVVYRAGVVPYYFDEEDTIKMLFMIPSDPKFGGEFPQCSKGKLENDEDYLDAALREGEEELGLFKGNITSIHDMGNFLGRTQFYIARIKDPDMFGDPHYETKETVWMSPEEFQKDGRDLHKPIVKAMVRKINKVKNIDNEC